MPDPIAKDHWDSLVDLLGAVPAADAAAGARSAPPEPESRRVETDQTGTRRTPDQAKPKPAAKKLSPSERTRHWGGVARSLGLETADEPVDLSDQIETEAVPAEHAGESMAQPRAEIPVRKRRDTEPEDEEESQGDRRRRRRGRRRSRRRRGEEAESPAEAAPRDWTGAPETVDEAEEEIEVFDEPPDFDLRRAEFEASKMDQVADQAAPAAASLPAQQPAEWQATDETSFQPSDQRDGDRTGSRIRRNVPTWDEVIGVIVSANMAQRGRQPRRDRDRGRPRRRGDRW